MSKRVDPGAEPPALPCASHAWERIAAALTEPDPDEFLDPEVPQEVVDEELLEMGVDVEAMADRAVALVARLSAGGVR